MNTIEIVTGALRDGFKIKPTPDGAVVSTHCIYPSGDLVRVFIRGGESEFVVSDQGGAISEIESAGAILDDPEKAIRNIVREFRLVCDRATKKAQSTGTIYMPHVGRDSLAQMIAIVANASKNAAEYLFHTLKIKRDRNFKELLRQLLQSKFDDNVKSDVLIGHSNKPHKFEHLIYLGGGSRIIVDPVMHDPSSINARVVANIDVKLAKYEKLDQRIVYHDGENWSADDLSLLQVGNTPVVPFSKAADVIGRLSRREA